MTIEQKAKVGWFTEFDFQYHACGGLGATGVVDMLHSPAHFRAGGSGPAEKTAHEGHLVHAALIEPERFKTNCVKEPDAPWTKSGKPEWLDFFQECDARGLLEIPAEECLTLKVADRPDVYKPFVVRVNAAERFMIDGIRKRFAESEVFTGLLEGIHERSGYLESADEFDKIILKTRPDIRNAKKNRIVDIKTTVDARDFVRNLIKLKYHVKAAWYMDICNAIDELNADYTEFVWLVIEKTPPYGVMAYRMDDHSDAFYEGRELGLKALTEFRDCNRSGSWPCYDDSIRDVKFPGWYNR
jgi:hypothetical protein